MAIVERSLRETTRARCLKLGDGGGAWGAHWYGADGPFLISECGKNALEVRTAMDHPFARYNAALHASHELGALQYMELPCCDDEGSTSESSPRGMRTLSSY